MSTPPDIIGRVKELQARCDSDSHLSEELENHRLTPARLAQALLIAVEALEDIAPSAKPAALSELDEPHSEMLAFDALSRIRSL